MPVKLLLKQDVVRWFEKSATSELTAHFIYQYLANQSQRLGFPGAQKYFLKESNDEMAHYNKLADFVNDMGGILAVPSVQKITAPINTIGDMLDYAYKIELDLMNQYKEFYEEAEEAEDCVTSTFIIEFMQIQRKSVGEFGDLISRYEKNKADVFEFDEYLGELICG